MDEIVLKLHLAFLTWLTGMAKRLFFFFCSSFYGGGGKGSGIKLQSIYFGQWVMVILHLVGY